MLEQQINRAGVSIAAGGNCIAEYLSSGPATVGSTVSHYHIAALSRTVREFVKLYADAENGRRACARYREVEVFSPREGLGAFGMRNYRHVPGPRAPLPAIMPRALSNMSAAATTNLPARVPIQSSSKKSRTKSQIFPGHLASRCWPEKYVGMFPP